MMNQRQVSTLNSLVTFAAENIPGGLSDEEQEVARIVGAWTLDAIPVRPVCPHCLAVAPYGDARLPWLSIHLDNPVHRWFWSLRRRVQVYRGHLPR